MGRPSAFYEATPNSGGSTDAWVYAGGGWCGPLQELEWSENFSLFGMPSPSRYGPMGPGLPASSLPTTTSPHGPVCVSTASINALLADTPLNGEGQDFYNAGQKYDVNPALAVVISDAESSFGANTNADWGFYNAWRWGATQPYRTEAQSWTTWNQGIYRITGNLSYGNYLGGNLTTTAAIYGRWCQSGNCAGGLRTIDSVLSQMGVSPDSLRFRACGGDPR